MKSKTFFFILLISLVLITPAFATNTWQPPQGNAPDYNADAPLNTGTIGQLKNGGLSLLGFFQSLKKVFIGNYNTPNYSPVPDKFWKSDDPAYDPDFVLKVQGNIGASKYCDVGGLNCKTITEMGVASSTGSLPVCTEGEVLKMVDGNWACADDEVGSGSDLQCIAGSGGTCPAGYFLTGGGIYVLGVDSFPKDTNSDGVYDYWGSHLGGVPNAYTICCKTTPGCEVGGIRYMGLCWYLGQSQTACTDTCASHGGAYNSCNWNFLPSNCNLQNLFANCAAQCSYDGEHRGPGVWSPQPPFACYYGQSNSCAAHQAGINRICACNE